MTRLELEHQIMDVVSHYLRVITKKGFDGVGLYLKRATNGIIFKFLTMTMPHAPLPQRIAWCWELVQAVEHVHSKRVIHCDVQPTNVLLDEAL